MRTSILIAMAVLLLTQAGHVASQQEVGARAITRGTEGRPSTKDAPDRVALVIGNADYRAVQRLQNPTNDARDICAAVSALAFETTCIENVATRRHFREAVRSFISKLRPGTAAFFYYAGHGLQIEGENFLLPTEIDPRSAADVEDEGLALSFLLRSLEEARSSPNIVILDACRDNPFSSGSRIRAGSGLARIDPPLGTVLIYATAPNKAAVDGNGRNGLFTKHLIANIPKSGLKLDELFQVVARAVEEEAQVSFKMSQVPYRSSSYSLPYCLAGCDLQPSLELDQIKRQTEEATRRLVELSEENARLRAQAAQRATDIQDRENVISRLANEAQRAGSSRSEIEAELARQKTELELLRARNSGAEKAERARADRDREFDELRRRIVELQKQEQDISSYRQQIEQLRRENALQGKALTEAASSKGAAPNIPEPAKRRSQVVVPSF